MSYDPRLDMVPIVEDACRVARDVQERLEDVRSITKDDRSPVTVADFAVQASIALALESGGLPIVGEEKSDVLREPEQAAVLEAVLAAVRIVHPAVDADDVLDAIDRCDHDGTADAYLALDPIDGTKGFLRGQQYAIALGMLQRGPEGVRVVMGALGCPNLPVEFDAPLDTADASGSVYAAIGSPDGHGGAANRFVDGAPAERLHVADDWASRAVRVCESVEKAHSKQSDTARILEHLGIESEAVRLDSQCKYAVVARGQADAYLRLPTKAGYVEKIWDHAAGSVVATSAGAVVTDITGAPLDFGHGPRLEANRGIICAVPGLHEQIIEAIAELGIGAVSLES